MLNDVPKVNFNEIEESEEEEKYSCENCNSICDNEKLFRCQANSHCVALTDSGFSCECDKGYRKQGNICIKKNSSVSIDDKALCYSDFVKKLERSKAHHVKNPEILEGPKTVQILLEPNLKGKDTSYMISDKILNSGQQLNAQTYTAFIEFGQETCGSSFAKAVTDGLVNFSVISAKVCYINLINT